METEAKESEFRPMNFIKSRVCSESSQLSFQAIREQSKLPLKRKSASSSLLYPPPRPPLPALKPTPIMHFNRVKLNDEIPDRQKRCKCKQSRCLKMYCLCFASGNYCEGCCCSNCQNTVEDEDVRKSALGFILQRNRPYFKQLFIRSREFSLDDQDGRKDALVLMKYKGCRCKRSRCVQRYCECHQAKIFCSGNCKCMECKNINESEEKFSEESKKLKDLENISSSNRKDKVNCLLGESQLIVKPAELCPLKFNYRSLLAGVIKPQNLRDFCAIMVVLSVAATAQEANIDPVHLEVHTHHEHAITNSATEMEKHNISMEDQGANLDGPLSGIRVDLICKDSTYEGSLQKERPISPGILTLTCHEKDRSLGPDASLSSSDKILNHDHYSKIYIEQEKLVLAKFRDFLNIIVSIANTKGSKLLADQEIL